MPPADSVGVEIPIIPDWKVRSGSAAAHIRWSVPVPVLVPVPVPLPLEALAEVRFLLPLQPASSATAGQDYDR